MRILIISLLGFFYAFHTMAQKDSTSDTKEKNFYIGISSHTIGYHIYYDTPRDFGNQSLRGDFFLYGLHAGYNFKEWFNLQVGLGFDASKQSSTSYNGFDAAGNAISYNTTYKTRAFSMPITGRYIIFNRHRKVPIYVTLNLMPAFGKTNYKVIKSEGNSSTILDNRTESGVNIFTTAGMGINFKIKKSFSGYTELLLFKRNLNGVNSRFWDWNAENQLSLRLIHSIGIGLNYNFKPKASS